MLLVADVRKDRQIALTPEQGKLWGIDKLNVVRSDIPAVTHIDYSARIQTVSRDDNSVYWDLLNAFAQKTGCSVVVNTSFNVRGEPIVCTPEDALKCFLRTGIDALVLGYCIVEKSKVPENLLETSTLWKKEFKLD
jgi:carbamoyltransferase